MESRLAQQKRDLLTYQEIQSIVKDWEDGRVEEHLDRIIVAREASRLENKFKRYNAPMLRDIPENKIKWSMKGSVFPIE